MASDGQVLFQNLSATLKQLDKAIDSGEDNLFQLYFNRGYCNHRLGCYRKALKVRGRLSGL